MASITSYFQRKPRKENVPTKRKQNATERPAGSSKKPKVDSAPTTRHQLSERTRSLNKDSFNAASSSSSSAGTVGRATPPQRAYATPKSLAKPSSSRIHGGPAEIIDLTVGPSSAGELESNTETNPFLLPTPKPIDSNTIRLTAASSILPPTPYSSIRLNSLRVPNSQALSSATPSQSLARQASTLTINPTTPTRPTKGYLEVVPETPGSPSIRQLKAALSELPGLSQIPSSQSQDVDIDFFSHKTGVSSGLPRETVDELSDPFQVPTSQSQEVEIDFTTKNEDALIGAITKDITEVPTSQTQEVEVDLSAYGRHDVEQLLSDDSIVPCSQSQDIEGIFLAAVSPRRKRVLREIEEGKRMVAATESLSGLVSQFQSEHIRNPQLSSDLGLSDQSGKLEGDIANTTVRAEDISFEITKDNFSKPEAQQHTDSDQVIVPIDEEDIQSLFDSQELHNVVHDASAHAVNAHQHHDEATVLPPKPSQASSVTESDSGDDQWMLQAQQLPHSGIVTHTDEGDGAFDRLPSSQPEVQSWQTDVSSYPFPQAALDFLDMLEEGPD
ncbi:hypothetical protein FB446DRAFT_720738 [Lentinula raphanica]|nr:hypothetical protein FB446DRAFT_720738 [Lentinula raphanica]